MTDKTAIINDLTKMLTNVASVAIESGKNIKENLAEKIKGSSENIGVATKDDIDILRQLIDKQSVEIEDLKIQISDLKNIVDNAGEVDDVNKKSSKKTSKASENQLI